MSLSADIEGFDGLKACMESVRKAVFDDTALMDIATQARDRVLIRTAAGKDAYGAEFKPYSTQYGRTKAKRGVDWKVVDLKLTGKMLADISMSADGGEAAIFFNSAESETKAAYHNSSDPGKGRVTRFFFGLSAEDKDFLEGLFVSKLDRALKDTNRG